MNAIISSKTLDIASRLHAPFGLSATLAALMTANPMYPYPIGIGNVSMRYSASNARKVARVSISTSNWASSSTLQWLRVGATHRTGLVIRLIDHQNVLLTGAWHWPRFGAWLQSAFRCTRK